MADELLMDILSKRFPNKKEAVGEIIRLRTQMAMPKGTEYFFSDIHGEDRAFIHLLRSASGNIRRKIHDVYCSRLSPERQKELGTLVYDPVNFLEKRKNLLQDSRWVRNTILELVEVARYISSKYTQSSIEEKFPERYQEVLHELFVTNDGEIDRRAYYDAIITAILDENAQEDFLICLCTMMQRICVNHIHILGDIFDRGPGPHKIIEELIQFGNAVDIQWGNHDAEWIGAALGNQALQMSVLRSATKYNTFDALEDGYDIHLRALNNFATKYYADDPCDRFQLKVYDENVYDIVDRDHAYRMHKACAILQFKLEGQLIERHPEYGMDDRNVLKKVDWDTMEYVDQGKRYPLKDKNFPTVDPKDPLKLNADEIELLNGINASFLHSERLQRHMTYLFNHGSTYLAMNGNLLFHGCVPMEQDGRYLSLDYEGKSYQGKALLDKIDYEVTQAYYAPEHSSIKKNSVDFMWYVWCGPKSPMFGKSKMATFENYFVGDKELCHEDLNPYYALTYDPEVCEKILEEFGLDRKKSHIINGHIPVKIKDGENPIRANGRLFVIDGGIAKAYQEKTGLAGYTLIFNSHHLALAEHKDYVKITDDLESYAPQVRTVDRYARRFLTGDTDQGRIYQTQIDQLRKLIEAYNNGVLKEQYVTSNFLKRC